MLRRYESEIVIIVQADAESLDDAWEHFDDLAEHLGALAWDTSTCEVVRVEEAG